MNICVVGPLHLGMKHVSDLDTNITYIVWLNGVPIPSFALGMDTSIVLYNISEYDNDIITHILGRADITVYILCDTTPNIDNIHEYMYV
jgi:hypothetical protein